MLSLSAPPSSSSACKVLASIPLASPVDGALSYGVEALKRLGGHVSVDNDKLKQKHEFPEDKINIPVGVNPKNLKNYTFYDLLGFTPVWVRSNMTIQLYSYALFSIVVSKSILMIGG